MYKSFNFEYNKDTLLALYKENKDGPMITKGPFNQLDINLTADQEVFRMFNYFTCINPPVNGHCGINELVYATGPHTSPQNNGLIIFPLEGSIVTRFFDYRPELVDGRPTLMGPLPNVELQSELYKSFTEQITIDRPTAINGLVVHQYIPFPETAVFFCFKIPLHVSWETVNDFLERL